MATLTQPIKWHGGKHYLAKAIIGFMPPRCRNPNKPDPNDLGWLHYVEPFFGGGSVLLAQDPEGISEVVNDLNSNLTMFWRVLQSPNDFMNLRQRLESTPFSADEYHKAQEILKRQLGSFGAAYWDKAAAFFVSCRQSMSGRMNNFAPLTRNRTRRGMNEQVSAWLNAIEGLPAIHARLQRVVILNDDAIKVIKQQDGPRTLFYLDPPYVHETRETTGEYEHEMTLEQHEALLRTLVEIEGRFILSGYGHELYHAIAQDNGWTCDRIEIDNKASSKKVKDIEFECVWRNFA